ncbi:MAG: PAS domain-containing sensor histidine kinase [Pseudomonadota bacterium]
MTIDRQALSRIFNKITEGVLIVDAKWKIMYANDAAREFLGLSPHDHKLHEDFFPQLNGRFIVDTDDIQTRKLQEQSFTLEADPLPDSKEKITLSIYISKVSSDGWRVILLRDITEEHKEQQLKRNFLSLISHKLRTPLTILKIGMDNLLQGIAGPFTEKQLNNLQRQHQIIIVLDQIINRLLTFSSIQDESLMHTAQNIDLVKFSHKFCKQFQRKNTNKTLNIIWGENLSNLYIRFSEQLLEKVFENILENSLKFSNKPKTTIKLNFFKNEATGETVAEINDDGPGIPPSVLRQAFEPFTQHDRDFTCNIEGFGLGLPIVQQVMKLYQGKTQIESNQESGTTIRLIFPQISP